MPAPQEHLVERLLRLAEEGAKLMWRSYDLHMTHDRRDREWLVIANHLFDLAMAADARVWRLRDLRLRNGRHEHDEDYAI